MPTSRSSKAPMGRASTTPVQPAPEEDEHRRWSIHSLHFPRRHTPEQPTNSKSKAVSPKGEKRGKDAKPPLQRTTSVQTRYMNMLLALDKIPRFHNILASGFTWILLAGYVIFPGTFTSLRNSDVVNGSDQDGDAARQAGQEALKKVANLPLLWVAAICCIIGASGMCWLWWKWKSNYVWLLNRIFLPGALNSLAGLVNTLINVYTAQGKHWSITAKVTACVTGGCMIVTGFLFGVYNFLALASVKRRHERDMQTYPPQEHEDLMHKINRKAHEPALEPSSVV